MELSSYWELANPWPCNTPTASLFVTCWMLFESETIGEDLLLTSSFSEHLIVDLPRLTLPWVCSHCDLEYWHTNMHRSTTEDTLYLPDTHRQHKLVWNSILHRQAHLNLDNMQLLTSVTVKTFSKTGTARCSYIFRNIVFTSNVHETVTETDRGSGSFALHCPLYLQRDWCLPRRLTAERSTWGN